MDEQRILDEMERMLAADDPRLSARLASFGQPGLGQALRTRRGRVTLSLMLLALLAAVAVVLYMMSAFRLNGGTTGGPGRSGSTHSRGAAGARGLFAAGVAAGAARRGWAGQPGVRGHDGAPSVHDLGAGGHQAQIAQPS